MITCHRAKLSSTTRWQSGSLIMVMGSELFVKESRSSSTCTEARREVSGGVSGGWADSSKGLSPPSAELSAESWRHAWPCPRTPPDLRMNSGSCWPDIQQAHWLGQSGVCDWLEGYRNKMVPLHRFCLDSSMAPPVEVREKRLHGKLATIIFHQGLLDKKKHNFSFLGLLINLHIFSSLFSRFLCDWCFFSSTRDQ